jgi:hypothetical protein
MAAFQLHGLEPSSLLPLFELDEQALRGMGAVRRIADESPGYPCRISLQDADVGDELLLLHHLHHDVPSPYRSGGPVFIRRKARQARLAVDEVPPSILRRLMSLRAYDAAHMMIRGDVCEGAQAGAVLGQFFDDPKVQTVHLHHARQGCFACRATRAIGAIGEGAIGATIA